MVDDEGLFLASSAYKNCSTDSCTSASEPDPPLPPDHIDAFLGPPTMTDDKADAALDDALPPNNNASESPCSTALPAAPQGDDDDAAEVVAAAAEVATRRSSDHCESDEEIMAASDSLSASSPIRRSPSAAAAHSNHGDADDEEGTGEEEKAFRRDFTSAAAAVERDEGSPMSHLHQRFHFGLQPIQSCEQLIEAIPVLDRDGLRRLTKPQRITQVLVLGATGRIGSLIVKYLALQHEQTPFTIHCVVRANNSEAAKTRLEAALEPLLINLDEIQKTAVLGKLRAWPGDVTQPGLGLSETDFDKLASRVEAIYVAVGYSDLSGNHEAKAGGVDTAATGTTALFTKSANVTVHCWSNVFMLASLVRQKHIYAFTSLVHLFEFLQPRASDNSTVNIVESHIDNLSELNQRQSSLSPFNNAIGLTAWCNGATEAILKYAKVELHYAVTIYRLPPYVFTGTFDNTNVDIIKRRPPLAWQLLRTFVQEGIMPSLPSYIFALYCQPIDLAVRDAVTLSFGNKRIYWIYHVFDERIQRQLNHENFLQVFKKLGVYLKLKTWTEFAEAVRARGTTESALGSLIDDIDAIAQQLATDRRVVVSTTHLQHDLQLNKEDCEAVDPSMWDSWRQYGSKAVRSLLHEGFFSEWSLGTLRSWEELLDEAKITSGGLSDLGEDGDLAEEGWRRFLAELDSMEKTPVRFSARCAAARTAVVYLTNMLYMREREKDCPEILEVEIRSPTFIVGLNRAGTTFTHQLLAQDTKHNRCPVLLEMLLPYGEKGDYRPVGLTDNDMATWKGDPRRRAADELIKLQTGGSSLANFGIMHHRESTSYEEELIVFEMLGRSYSLCAGYNAPQLYEWLMDDDCRAVRAAYRFHKRFFQHLEYQRPGKRWVFKLPWHLLTIETLFETYPDAELLFLHRRPVSALTSWVGLELMMQRAYLREVDAPRIGPRGLEVMARMMDKAMDYQERLAVRFVQNHPGLQPPQSFFMNVYFEELITTPVAVVGEIYQALDWGVLCGAAERALWQFLEAAAKLRGEIKLPTCDLAEVGLSKGEARARFARYTDAYFDPAQRLKRKGEIRIARAIRYNALDKEAFYTENGTIVNEQSGAASWLLDPQALEGPRRSFQQIMSYARSKLTMTE